MVWNSIFLMTIIDLIIIGSSLYSVLIFKKYHPLLKKLKLEPAVAAILLGLLTVSLFYLADLFTMFVLPSLTSHAYAMAVMQDLHLNLSWAVNLLGVIAIVTGLSQLIRELLPKTYRNLTNLEAIEVEIREFNAQLEAKVEARTLELEMTNQQLYQEVQERILVEKELRKSKNRYQRLVERVPALIDSDSNLKGRTYYSRQIQDYLGYSLEHLEQNPKLWYESIHPDDRSQARQVIQDFIDGKHFNIEYRIRDAQGHWRWLYDVSVGRQFEGDEIVVEGVAIDITSRKESEPQLEHAAFHDSLTQLPNRALLIQHIDQALEQLQTHQDHKFAVLFIDLDRFKIINDSLGHQWGDLLLLEISKRFKQIIQTSDIVAQQL
jgi:PAS domain S-box-containing protein